MPGNTIGNTVPKGYFLRSAAAKMVGRSTDTLKRWHDAGTYEATHYMMNGQTKTWLYSISDIKKMKELAATQHPGRKPKESGAA